jgi:hypothetical protein
MRWRPFAILSLLLVGIHGCSSDVSGDAKLRGGYSKGQTLRLRVDAYAYKFNEVHHPAEAGTQITVAKASKLEDATARVAWERRNASMIIAQLPAGTVFRVERIDYVPTLDTAIVPRAVIINGTPRGEKIALSGISTEVVSTGYPNPVAPDPNVVEPAPAK